jgi:hypothetical protein
MRQGRDRVISEIGQEAEPPANPERHRPPARVGVVIICKVARATTLRSPARAGPQPHAAVWFGLLKMNCADSFSNLVVHLGAEQEQHRLRLDENAHSFVFDHLVERIDLFGVFHGVAHAGAAAIFDADAHRRDRAVGLRRPTRIALRSSAEKTSASPMKSAPGTKTVMGERWMYCYLRSRRRASGSGMRRLLIEQQQRRQRPLRPDQIGECVRIQYLEKRVGRIP